MTKNSFDEAFVIFMNELKKDTNREKDFNKISNLQEAIDYATDKAYRDMQLRTIKGHKIDIKNKSIQFLKTKLNELFVGQGVRDFDSWHNGACETFLGAFNAEANKYNFTQQGHGKAQKIVNMSLKYLYCIFYCNQNNEFDDNINRFDMDKEEVKSIFEKCHMPLDSYTLNWYYHKLGKKQEKIWHGVP